jgi:hypothetical protein
MGGVDEGKANTVQALLLYIGFVSENQFRISNFELIQHPVERVVPNGLVCIEFKSDQQNHFPHVFPKSALGTSRSTARRSRTENVPGNSNFRSSAVFSVHQRFQMNRPGKR